MLKYVISGAKILFALGLIIYLLQSGKLNLDLAFKVFSSPGHLIIPLIIFFIIFFVGTHRYSLVLRTWGTKVSYPLLLKLNWIGVFFNSVLPGSVTGDLIKVFYIQREFKEISKKFLFASILIDRVAGLCGLVFSLGLFTIINLFTQIKLSQKLEFILNFNIFLFSSMVLFFIAVFFFGERLQFLFSKLKALSLGEKLNSIVQFIVDTRRKLLLIALESFLVQFLSVVLFWYLAKDFSSSPLSLLSTLTIIPIGFLFLAVPISPSGIGVGHSIFHFLLLQIGIHNGADLFNIYFIFVLILNLTGILPYILLKRNQDL